MTSGRKAAKYFPGKRRDFDPLEGSLSELQKNHSVKRLCEVLKLNRSSFYKWKNSSSARRKRLMSDAILGARVKTVFAAERGCYGAKRITAELKDQAGHDPVNHKRVARVMRELKLFGYTKKRKVTTTVSDQKKPVFPDLVGRKFTADKPNQLLTSGTSPTCRLQTDRICTWPRSLIAIHADWWALRSPITCARVWSRTH